MCFTIDPSFCRYRSFTHIQTPLNPNTLSVKISEALKAFKVINSIYPTQIIMYLQGMSGVGNAKSGSNTNIELAEEFKVAFQLLEMPMIPLYIVLVNGKCETRLYLASSGELKCPMPGTILNQQITNRDIPEFFLVSQRVHQGLAVPTHYQVVREEIAAGIDKKEFLKKVEDVTFKLCYLYYNVSGSIRIPAPLKYASCLTNLLSLTANKGKIASPCAFFEDSNSLFFI
jgi:aubergine-like protein